MFDRMSSQLEPLDDELLGGSAPVDLEDRGDAYVVTVDVPGFDEGDIDVELAGETLTISATKTESNVATDEGTDGDGSRYLRRERSQQSVSRSVRLPEAVDETACEATYRNGVLTVTLPKVDADTDGHSIPVE